MFRLWRVLKTRNGFPAVFGGMVEVVQAIRAAVFFQASGRRFQFAKPPPTPKLLKTKTAHTRIEVAQCGYVNYIVD